VGRGFDEYRETAEQVNLVEVHSREYYGEGYQDVMTRVPKIENTCAELGWKPQIDMRQALGMIFDFYRSHVAEARGLI